MNNDDKSQQNNKPKEYKELFNASSVGFAVVTGILVGGVMGYYLDKFFNTAPWLLFIFLAFGLIAGIKNALYFMKKAGISFDDSKYAKYKQKMEENNKNN